MGTIRTEEKTLFIAEWAEMLCKGISPIFETDEGVVYINFDQKTNKLEAGGCSNTGFMAGGIDIDYDFSVGENLQELIDEYCDQTGETTL